MNQSSSQKTTHTHTQQTQSKAVALLLPHMLVPSCFASWFLAFCACLWLLASCSLLRAYRLWLVVVGGGGSGGGGGCRFDGRRQCQCR